MDIRIEDLPETERPRERLWAKGPAALTDRELLALVLRNGRRGLSVLGLADELLVNYGGLGAIAAAHPEELASFPGVGKAKAAAVLAACKIGQRLVLGAPSELVRSPDDLAAIAIRELAGCRRERVLVIVMAGRNRLRRIVPISDGKADRVLFPIREILNAVIRNDGEAFAVAHNHPSGCIDPSPEDISATKEIAQAACIVGVRFLDHLIVSGTSWARVAPNSVVTTAD